MPLRSRPPRALGRGGVPALLLVSWGLVVAVAAPAHAADRVLLDPRISESSGLVASTLHPGILWTHNDSGHPPELFAVGQDGQTVATVTLAGAEARDWEALAPGRDATGRPLLWVGDIGDNREVRPYVRLYRVVEPSTLSDARVAWTEFRLSYPDGPHNAEALLVDPRTQAAYVVTKSVTGAAIYAVPRDLKAAPAVNSVTRLAAAPSMVTDGAFAPDGSRLVLIGYLSGTVFSRIDGPGRPIALPLRPQGESVTWASPTELLVGSEGSNSPVAAVAVPLSVAASRSASTSGPSSAPAQAGSGAGSDAVADAGSGRWVALGAALVALVGLAGYTRFRMK